MQQSLKLALAKWECDSTCGWGIYQSFDITSLLSTPQTYSVLMGLDSVKPLQEADRISYARQEEDSGNWVAAMNILTNTDYLSITQDRFLELAQMIDSAAQTHCTMDVGNPRGIRTQISQVQEDIRRRRHSYNEVIKTFKDYHNEPIPVKDWDRLESRSSEISVLIVTFRHLLTFMDIDLPGEPPVAKLERGQKIISWGKPGCICVKSQGPWKACVKFVEMKEDDWT